MNDEIIIGLEVHVQLKTKSKLFCGCSTEFGAEPNENTCPICLGWPGTLPVLNRRAVEFGMLAALSLNCEINEDIKFDRKNYFYPDLPKAYQISQYDMPLAEEGLVEVELDGGTSEVGIERLHLEEDAGKLVHSEAGAESYVDYNRTSVPLAEIVTKPDITSPEQAEVFLRSLKQRMEYLGVSDCNMEEGSLRCDANLSVRTPEGELGTKTEVKNMNSFKGVKKALAYEARRQKKLLSSGGEVVQETRLWDEAEEVTREMRSKEAAHDYRYFPEPDLVPVKIGSDWQKEMRERLPEMPEEKYNRFKTEYGLPEEAIETLTAVRPLADFFEQAVTADIAPRSVSNLIISDLKREMNERDWTVEDVNIRPENITAIARMFEDDVISSNVCSELIAELVESGGDPEAIVEERDLKQISDAGELEAIIDEVIKENPDAVEDIRSGADQAIGFLIGQVMQKTQGQADPAQARKMLQERI